MSCKTIVKPSIEDRFLDIPYKLGGKGFDGADCMGIIILFLAEHGMNYEYDHRRLDQFMHLWEHQPRRFMDFVYRFGNFVKFGELQRYDAIFFLESGSLGSFPSWPGVMVDDRHFLTTYDKKTSHVQMLNVEWKSRFWGAIRPNIPPKEDK